MREDYLALLESRSHIETARLLLRPFVDEDAQDMFKYASDEQNTRYMLWPAHTSTEVSLHAIREFCTGPGQWAISLRDEAEHRCIGSIGVRIYPDRDTFDFGYIIHRDFWNQGYVTEATKAMIKLGFDELGAHRVEATCFSPNKASASVMKKCGLVYEGTSRESVLANGIHWDVDHYGMLKKEWDTLN